MGHTLTHQGRQLDAAEGVPVAVHGRAVRTVSEFGVGADRGAGRLHADRRPAAGRPRRRDRRLAVTTPTIVQRLLDGAVAELAGPRHRPRADHGGAGARRLGAAAGLPAAGRGRRAPRGGRAGLRDPRRDAALRLRLRRGRARHHRRAPRDTGVPVAFGVVTTDTLEQAEARAGGAHGNKGAEAAEAAVEMAGLMRTLPRRRLDPAGARVRQRRQHAVQRPRRCSNAGGSDSRSPSCSIGSSVAKPGPERGDLEQHAGRLAEVDRAEVEAVDHRRRVVAGLRDLPLPVVVLLELDAQATWWTVPAPRDARARPAPGRAVEGAAAARRARSQRASPSGSKPSVCLQQLAPALGSAANTRTPAKPCSASSSGISGCSAVKRRIGAGEQLELEAEPFGVGEAQAIAAARGRSALATAAAAPRSRETAGDADPPDDRVHHAGAGPCRARRRGYSKNVMSEPALPRSSA